MDMKKQRAMLVLSVLALNVSLSAQVQQEVQMTQIELGCRVLGSTSNEEHIIRSDVEYQALFNNRSLHPDCMNYQTPKVDFQDHTLIGFVSSVAGCKQPTVSYRVMKERGDYLVEIDVIQQGLCKPKNIIDIWFLIPHVEADSQVRFDIDNKVNPD